MYTVVTRQKHYETKEISWNRLSSLSTLRDIRSSKKNKHLHGSFPNKSESAPNRNVAYIMLIYPSFMPKKQQYFPETHSRFLNENEVSLPTPRIKKFEYSINCDSTWPDNTK